VLDPATPATLVVFVTLSVVAVGALVNVLATGPPVDVDVTSPAVNVGPEGASVRKVDATGPVT
jgi:hypothetical protein